MVDAAAIAKMAVSVAAPLAAGAAAGEVFADEHMKLIAYLAATVTAVVAVVSWVRHEIRDQTDAQSRMLLRELRHYQQLISVRFGLPELAPPEVTGEIELSKD